EFRGLEGKFEEAVAKRWPYSMECSYASSAFCQAIKSWFFWQLFTSQKVNTVWDAWKLALLGYPLILAYCHHSFWEGKRLTHTLIDQSMELTSLLLVSGVVVKLMCLGFVVVAVVRLVLGASRSAQWELPERLQNEPKLRLDLSGLPLAMGDDSLALAMSGAEEVDLNLSRQSEEGLRVLFGQLPKGLRSLQIDLRDSPTSALTFLRGEDGKRSLVDSLRRELPPSHDTVDARIPEPP
ncbi:unnamed protein product, partial [Effrenium voratum]